MVFMSVAGMVKRYRAGDGCLRILAGLLILGATGVRIAYLAHDCPLDLAPDEAHYWDWSRHLEWSYYSKGPLVAYLIRAGCVLAGNLSQQWTGSEMLAVRLPAVICGALLLVSVYILTRQIYGNERMAVAVVALALTLPVVAAGSELMTIDAPYACCWGWALVLGYCAIFGRSAWAWPAAGIVVGLGILAKYTMVLWLPSVGLFLLFSPEYRRLLWRPGFWITNAVAAACCLPILIWNFTHDWVTVRHVNGLAGLNNEGVRWLGPVVYVGIQCALFLGFWFITWVLAMWAYRPWLQPNAGTTYLWWMSAPMFAVFLAFGLKTGGGEPNWPITAYISGLVLTAGWIARRMSAPERWRRRLIGWNMAATCGLGLALIVIMHHTDWIYPLLSGIVGPATAEQPLPLRNIDPTCRLRGWPTLAQEVDRLRSELVVENIEPILAGTSWALPGEIGFYCQGHPAVYSIGLPLGERHSQYDLWHPNPIADPEAFKDRTFIVVGGGLTPEFVKAFDQVEAPRWVVHYQGGQPIAQWPVLVCRRYHGVGVGKPLLPEF
jgi:hypothetical protein